MIKRIYSSPWPSILWTIFIFILLTIDSPSLSPKTNLKIPHMDKFVHAGIFGILVLVWWLYLYPFWKKNFLILIIFVFSTMYGIGMEYYQLAFTNREYEVADMFADGIGSLLAALVCIWAKNKPLWK